MRKITLILFSLLFVVANVFSQDPSETLELEIKFDGPGKVTLLNGEVLEGEISYSFTSNNKLMLKKTGEEKAIKYTTVDVKMFSINDTYFVRLKGVMLETFGLITSKPETKIQFVKTTTQSAMGVPSDEGFKHKTRSEIYVLFVKQEKALSIADIGLTNKKIAELTNDCEELSKKIANKDPEYKIGMMTPAYKKMEIIKAISEVYQNCN